MNTDVDPTAFTYLNVKVGFGSSVLVPANFER